MASSPSSSKKEDVVVVVEDKDEVVDSLFEGMVLFDPSNHMPDHDGHHHHQEQPPPPPPPPPPMIFSPPPPAEDDDDPVSFTSQPLDESLFSDLTLITPTTPIDDTPQTLVGVGVGVEVDSSSDPSISITLTTTSTTREEEKQQEVSLSPSSSLLSRQSSSSTLRKKKRAGLRIGYGRQEVTSPIPHRHHHTLDVSSQFVENKSTEAADKQNVEEDDEEEPPPPPTAVEEDYNSKGVTDSSNTNPDDNSMSIAEPSVVLSEDLEKEDEPASTGGSIELKFEKIKTQISEKLKLARELVSCVTAARKDSTRRRRKAAENVILASTKHRELEKELEEACEAEEFETAERVSENLATAEKEKERLAIALRDAEADCDAVDTKMQEVLELQIAAEEECASLLEIFAKDAANNADLVFKDAEVVSSKEMDKWLLTTEALEVKKMELEIESHLINEARLVLNDSIEHSVEDDRRERELLSKRKETLTEELEKLLALVKEKEAEIAENNFNIEIVEKRIADAVSGFQDVQSNINAKYDNLQSGLCQVGLDNEALARKKKEIDEFMSQEEDRGANLRKLAQISADEAKMYQEVVGLRKSLVLFVLKSREDRARLAKTEENLSDDVQMLRHDVTAARASLQELSSTKSSIQQDIESLKQRLLFIDKRVPELEAEKKVAAAARNFKEAARVAAEAKTLIVEKETVQIKMERAILELGKLEEEICDTVNRLQETEEQILSKEKDVAMARFQRLLLIAGAATAERSAALELGDLEEADILLAEAEAADSEARKLQPVYNFVEEEFATVPKHFISMELISNLGGKQLVELAASAHISAM
ncbi:uncharacterized protein LOC132276627 [Cornus florida]|uniref:uncharacterized protein LOC132276627 n=1 Tax=Cornus florida TaxID=4283 RepID=UPI00289AF9A5|nr:uncharacterized protein LOC132276627 [Cornus florida]